MHGKYADRISRGMIFSGIGSRSRAVLLDETRGFCILLMVLYHAAYDLVYIFNVNVPVFHWALVRFAQPVVAGIFVFISGIVCRYSRSNLKRGLLALALGLGMSAFTLWLFPSQPIYFGILHLLGVCMLLFAALYRTLDRVTPLLGILVCTLFWLLTFRLGNGWIGIPGLLEFSLPDAWNQYSILLPLGLAGKGADYFPLLPWAFVFFAGSFLGIPFAQGEMPAPFYERHNAFLSTVGRYTIFIYVLHQPVVFGILWSVFFLIGKLSAG